MKKTLIFLLCFILIPSIFFAGPRSSKWPSVRKEYLNDEKHPEHKLCFVCESGKSIEVHHIKPFHLYPNLELDPTNFVTLCDSKYPGFNCHLMVGHGGNFKWENPWVLDDIFIVHNLILKYKGYTVVPDEISQYLKFIHERVKEYNNKYN